MIELIGFEKEYNDLLKRFKSNNLPNSILIHGLSGIAVSYTHLTLPTNREV